MSSWCQQLQQSLIEDSRWKATILFNSSYASALNKIIIDESNDCSSLKNNCNDDVESSRDIIMSSSQDYDYDTMVNIVNLLDPQKLTLISKLKSIVTQHSYPNTASF